MIINEKRALAYIVNIDNIEPIEGADNIALATVGGWRCLLIIFPWVCIALDLVAWLQGRL